jgi:hypothetical protein
VVKKMKSSQGPNRMVLRDRFNKQRLAPFKSYTHDS